MFQIPPTGYGFIPTIKEVFDIVDNWLGYSNTILCGGGELYRQESISTTNKNLGGGTTWVELINTTITTEKIGETNIIGWATLTPHWVNMGASVICRIKRNGVIIATGNYSGLYQATGYISTDISIESDENNVIYSLEANSDFGGAITTSQGIFIIHY